jgi:uncharacterized protein
MLPQNSEAEGRSAVAVNERDVGVELAAGDFSSWVTEMGAAIRGECDANVACDGCTACCTSSQFIHIEPDETETLKRIPRSLLFPAPQRPKGHVLMGYNDLGHCPMLIDNRCSIYEDRPRTCRTYDCRVFPAAGLIIDDKDHVMIARRAERWQFSYESENSVTQHVAIRAAAAFLQTHHDELPAAVRPKTTTQLAVLAFQLHELFLDGECDCEGELDIAALISRLSQTHRD